MDDHIGCLAVNAAAEIVAANWDARTFYRLSPDGKKLDEIANPRNAAYQDLKFSENAILACGTEKHEQGATRPVVDRLDDGTLALLARWEPRGTLRTGGSNFCREGSRSGKASCS